MVYLGNIFNEYGKLSDNLVIKLFFKSGHTSIISANDLIEKANGDLKIVRELPYSGNTVITYVDCAEIERIIITGADNNDI